jgi:hypothetical protein
MAEKEEKVSFVRLDSANLVKMTFGNLAKKFAEYTRCMIDIKRLSDEKTEKRKELIQKIKDLEKNFESMLSMLPKAGAEEKIIKRFEMSGVDQPVEVEGDLGSFEDLRKEFEKLKGQLEDIKRTV